MDNETFIDVKGYEGLYKIGSAGTLLSFNNGRRKRLAEPRTLKPRINPSGYHAYYLGANRPDKKGWNITAHRLVALNFIPNPNNLPEVNHKNGNKIDNRVENLEWMSKADNMRHAFNVLGRVKPGRGERAIHAILTVSDVVKIKTALKDRNRSYQSIGREFGISGAHVSRIDHGKCWEMVAA